MKDEIKSQQPRRPGRPKGSKNRIKRAKPLSLAGHVQSVLKETGLEDSQINRAMIESRIINPNGRLLEQIAKGDRVRSTGGSARLMGRLATSEALASARDEMKRRVQAEAVAWAPQALDTLTKMIGGAIDCPPAVRRLACLDVLQIAGIATIGTNAPQTPGNKPVSELSADELRALLGQQRAALEKLDAGLGRVVDGEAESVH
ncbi:MAG: hypothetical protein IPJ48_11020 [Propionivibrio sp.]|uniref:Uncharacterized protein n=1 Tax=Candidatus Propionivibrio dominans TaxID=2954373 RepID=A0A9D7F7K1_9RHOO|nr:hypothetical protein [Candidatus Propionivibrio dominans]MBL0166883.1 hypothetical protein [Propionivibrio sp.]